MTRHVKFAIAALMLVAAIPLVALTSPSVGTAGLSWLAGCWQGGKGTRVIEEAWMRPRNGVMLGLGRVSSGEAIRDIEFVELRLRGDSLDYVVIPSGQARTTFSGTMTGPQGFLVRNPAHDFPTIVSYELVGRDSLSAWIEGPIEGKTRRIAYDYHRVGCEER